ncbi:MAG: hypothetical protein K2I80_00775 [Ruminococcus sp.]|nr:hypothetical protein [Ruminococcus sp.]MDE6849340.1 hypothetical protein [Ruminococcus sp.]
MDILLKRGITGFYEKGDLCLNETYFSEFVRICYLLQTVTNFKIKSTVNTECASYFSAELTDGKSKIYFLLNKYYNVGGFTDNLIFGDKIFTDIDLDNNYLTECEIVPALVLNSAFSETAHDLSKCELEQVEYWKPFSVGNIIFNEWD